MVRKFLRDGINLATLVLFAAAYGIAPSCAGQPLRSDSELSYWQRGCALGQRVEFRLDDATFHIEPRWISLLLLNRDLSPKALLPASDACPTAPQHARALHIDVSLALGDTALPNGVQLGLARHRPPMAIPSEPATRRTTAVGAEIDDTTPRRDEVDRDKRFRSYRIQQSRRENGALPPPITAACVSKAYAVFGGGPGDRHCTVRYFDGRDLHLSYWIKVPQTEGLTEEPEYVLDIDTRVRAFVDSLTSKP